ncbi:hypothetical protein CL622_08490, partial [archaeon]|nr:hypothetical protein [archaeon]
KEREIQISVGALWINPKYFQTTVTPIEIFGQTDDLLFRAKNDGKDQVIVDSYTHPSCGNI